MPSAVVVGAGIGGLAAAGALARADWQVTLLERADRLRGDGAGLFLWPDGVDALRRLGLAGGLDAIATPVQMAGVRTPDGGWLVLPDEAPVGAALVVHREDLHDALVAGLGDRVDIRTGVAVRSVRMFGTDTPGASDGTTTWEADLVVAADGADSMVRRRLAPEAAVSSAGCTAFRAVIPWYRAAPLVERLSRLPAGGTGGETVGAGHRFRWAILGARAGPSGAFQSGVYWSATVPGAARPEPAAGQLALLRRWFADWHAPIGELIGATEPDELIQHTVGEVWPLPRAFAYHAGGGGYALVGDAAHAMAHHLGTGACLALQDAAALVAAVARAAPGAPLGRALNTYAQQRRADVLPIGRQSRRVGAALTAARSVARTRDAVLGLAPGPLGRASGAVRRMRRPWAGVGKVSEGGRS